MHPLSSVQCHKGSAQSPPTAAGPNLKCKATEREKRFYLSSSVSNHPFVLAHRIGRLLHCRGYREAQEDKRTSTQRSKLNRGESEKLTDAQQLAWLHKIVAAGGVENADSCAPTFSYSWSAPQRQPGGGKTRRPNRTTKFFFLKRPPKSDSGTLSGRFSEPYRAPQCTLRVALRAFEFFFELLFNVYCTLCN